MGFAIKTQGRFLRAEMKFLELKAMMGDFVKIKTQQDKIVHCLMVERKIDELRDEMALAMVEARL